ncbi:MAG: aminodeoxychorismate/anthranilate synthase component II [Bacteroidota bacterium]
MKVLVIDNYDSFTYNLVHILREIGIDHEVHRNDKIEIEAVDKFDKIIFSPGPGIPSEAGNMPEIIGRYVKTKPMLGICLGHQAIAEHFGGRLVNMPKVYHGIKTKIITTDTDVIFNGLPETFEAGRYHSWKVDKQDLPDVINVTAEDEVGDIMAFSHKAHKLFGLQFHPESIMTTHGKTMIENFLNC